MNLLDRIIGYVAPAAAARRLQARATLQQIMAMSAAPNNIYPQAKTTRTNKVTLSVYKENEASSAVTDNLRAQSWRLYRTNPSARKIVRTLQSKVIGRGMHPEPLAMNADGTPNEAFRDRCKELWKRLNAGFDSRGLPAQGGQTLAGLQRVALQAVILSGDALFRMKPITPAEQTRRDLPIPLTLQLIDSCRLADETEVTSSEIPGGSSLFRGIELDEENRRTAYYIRLQPAYASANQSGNAVRIPADQMGHLYVEEDIDQLRGVPWFSAALTRTQDTADLEYNVLKSTALAACVVGAYAKPTGATKFGLNASSTAPDDLTDGDGNTVTKLQPGLLVNTGRDGKFELHSPNQPNMIPRRSFSTCSEARRRRFLASKVRRSQATTATPHSVQSDPQTTTFGQSYTTCSSGLLITFASQFTRLSFVRQWFPGSSVTLFPPLNSLRLPAGSWWLAGTARLLFRSTQ